MPSLTSIAIFEPRESDLLPLLRPESILADITRFGPFDALGAGVALELGVSLWYQRSGACMDAVRSVLLELQEALWEVADLDPATEPVPLRGRCERTDLLQLASSVGQLVRRAAGRTGWEPEALAAAVSKRTGPAPSGGG